MPKFKRFVMLMVVVFLLDAGVACAGGYMRLHPEFSSRIDKIKTVLVVSDVKLYEILVGGGREYREEWSIKTNENVLKALEVFFQRKQIQPVIINAALKETEEFRDFSSLYQAVAWSIGRHSCGLGFFFPEKIKKFEYSVGPLDTLLNDTGADAVVFITMVDEISSAGRKAIMTASMIAGALVGLAVVPNMGANFIFASLIDRTGDVLWFNLLLDGGARTDQGASLTVKRLFSELIEEKEKNDKAD